MSLSEVEVQPVTGHFYPPLALFGRLHRGLVFGLFLSLNRRAAQTFLNERPE